MISASGAGAAFVAVPPKRLKSKSKQPPSPPQSPSSHRTPAATRPPPLPFSPQSPSARPRDIDPALAIEYLLNRSRLPGSPSLHSPTESGIGGDEWARGFVPGNKFLLGLSQEDPVAPIGTLPQPEEQRSTARKQRRPRPNSHPSPLLPPEDLTPAPSSPPPPPKSSHHGLGLSSWGFGVGKHWHVGEQRSGKDSGKMSTVRDINIAVVGAAGVGKTTFIERAYDLQAPARHGELHSMSMMMDRAPCHVSLVEVDWGMIDFDKEPMQWPRVADGQRIPFIDGVLLLYDQLNPLTISRLPQCLEAFEKAQLPAFLVSTKHDVHGPPVEAAITTISDEYEQMQTSVTAHDSQKKCMAAILTMISRRNEKSPRYLTGRRRANSSAANSRAASPRPSTGHNRASSEFCSTFLKDGSDTGSIHGTRLQRPPASTALGQPSGTPCSSLSSAPLSSDSRKNSSPAPQITLSSAQTFLEVVSTSSFSMQHSSSQSSLGDSERRHSYIDTDDDESMGFKDIDDIPILDREDGLDDLDEEDKPPPNRGWSWDELINRLLSQPMSRSDQTFVIIFLVFYRKFAAPRDLLNAIIDRFRELESEEKIRVHRIAAQLRYCNILHQWVTSHPGDFANHRTRKHLLVFLDSISTDRSLAFLATEMSKVFRTTIVDEDEMWGRTDLEVEKRSSLQSFMTASSSAFPDCPDKILNLSLDNPVTNLQVPGQEKRAPELGEFISAVGSTMGLTMLRSETSPPPSSGGIMTRAGCQFELFMTIPVPEIASELTRIDWEEFSRIRPRDLVRHISVPASSRENSLNLACVNNMISHFNHVACWVASVILEKPKPKHRAKALEKFMEIAWTLRHQNNYNSLGAIIAGINGTAIHRLNQTRELVRPEVQKNFMRLELLMGTHKSHSKYRLAWENTTSERIPFLPLHRRDLVSAEEGNKTFLQDGEKINWNKFQVMGDVMMVLVRAQATPYKKNFDGNSTIDTMIRNAAMTMNDDELYERSVQLESAATASVNKSRRNWFQLKTNTGDQRS